MNNSHIRLKKNISQLKPRENSAESIPSSVADRRRHIIRLYLTAILLLSMMLTVYVWQSTKMVEVKLRIKRIEKNTYNIKSSNTNLMSDISKLQSISRIEKIARNELGMIVPKKLYYINMPKLDQYEK